MIPYWDCRYLSPLITFDVRNFKLQYLANKEENILFFLHRESFAKGLFPYIITNIK